jgi:hypothetical protein
MPISPTRSRNNIAFRAKLLRPRLIISEVLSRPSPSAVLTVHPSEPRLLPEHQALRLTSAVSRAVAAKFFQVHCAQHPTPPQTIGGVAGLVRALEDTEPLPAGFKHLWHKWQAFQLSISVQRPKYLLSAANLHPLARA